MPRDAAELSVSELVSFFEGSRCQRRVALTALTSKGQFNSQQSANHGPGAVLVPKFALDAGLAANGKAWEEEFQSFLHGAGSCMLSSAEAASQNHSNVRDALAAFRSAAPGASLFAAEVDMRMQVGNDIMLKGRADFLLLTWQAASAATSSSNSSAVNNAAGQSQHANLRPVITVLECKASSDVKPSHELQAACCVLMLQHELETMCTHASDPETAAWAQRVSVNCGVVVQGQRQQWASALDPKQHACTSLTTAAHDLLMGDEQVRLSDQTRSVWHL